MFLGWGELAHRLWASKRLSSYSTPPWLSWSSWSHIRANATQRWRLCTALVPKIAQNVTSRPFLFFFFSFSFGGSDGALGEKWFSEWVPATPRQPPPLFHPDMAHPLGKGTRGLHWMNASAFYGVLAGENMGRPFHAIHSAVFIQKEKKKTHKYATLSMF